MEEYKTCMIYDMIFKCNSIFSTYSGGKNNWMEMNIFNRIDPSDLKPEESAYLNFRCDAGSLRESINSFGKIEANGLPHAVFVQAGNPSRSLPKHVEEYEDAEHDVLYKTLQEVQQAKTSSSCVSVCVWGGGGGEVYM